MARVLVIGGIFLKCRDRARLAAWYAVWGPFDADSGYFRPSRRAFMLNLVVVDVDAAIALVVAAGGRQIDSIEGYEYGRFGWFGDPEGNKVELWYPASD